MKKHLVESKAAYLINSNVGKINNSMKKVLFIAQVFFIAFLVSCLEFDNSIGVTTSADLRPADGSVLPNEIMPGDTLLLRRGMSFALLGALRIPEGSVLQIEPGVTISAAGGQPPSLFIVIESGAKILAEGTDDEPIVFTASDETPGAWGGLIIAGKAPINIGNTAIAEIGDVVYGGQDPNDNSGVLNYVRVEYTGSSINSEREHNGITLYGVGNGTKIDFVEAFFGADDGIEIFGGTVDLSHVVCVGSQDDQFDFVQGWTGNVSFLYIQQVDDPTYVQDRGIEGDNLSSDNEAIPFSNPSIQNVTLVGFSSADNEINADPDAIRIREGAKGNFNNILVRNYPGSVMDVRSLVTLENLGNDELVFSEVFFEGITTSPFFMLDNGEPNLDTDLLNNVENKLNNAISSEQTTGAGFELWRGNFARLP